MSDADGGDGQAKRRPRPEGSDDEEPTRARRRLEDPERDDAAAPAAAADGHADGAGNGQLADPEDAEAPRRAGRSRWDDPPAEELPSKNLAEQKDTKGDSGEDDDRHRDRDRNGYRGRDGNRDREGERYRRSDDYDSRGYHRGSRSDRRDRSRSRSRDRDRDSRPYSRRDSRDERYRAYEQQRDSRRRDRSHECRGRYRDDEPDKRGRWGDREEPEEGRSQQPAVVRKGRGFGIRAAAGGETGQQQQQQQEGGQGGDAGGAEGAAAVDGGGGGGGGVAAAEGAANGGAGAAPKKPVNTGRAGGAYTYIPPFKLARMMAEIQDKSSPEAQRMTWDALRKSLNGLINKVSTANIKNILPELFSENLMRGRGLFCQSLMKAQMASPNFTPVYAALVAVVNTKFPELGELLLHRVISQFKRAYKRNDKPVCVGCAKFLAHLINQGVVHEVLALEMMILMLENPSDDSVEVAVDFCKDVGAYLQDVAPAGLNTVFERFRTILHEGEIDRRVQYMIENLFAVRKAGFGTQGFAAVAPELDLVDAEDQITHEMELEEKHDPQANLNVFKVNPEYELHEQQYQAIKKEILGEEEEEEEEEEEGASEGGSGSEESSEEEEDAEAEEARQEIEDATQTNLVNLRRTIYLTIMSSLDFEEAGHKLLKIQMKGNEAEIPIMIIECCSNERTYNRYYGLLAARFCMIGKEYQGTFEDCFGKQYAVIHRLETNKLRNVAHLFAHLLSVDGISWGVLQAIRITEEDTTSSSRIFIKFLFQAISEYLGLVKLNERLQEPSLQPYFAGLFPDDSMANMRFSINFFTSIGLGGVTDRMREKYKELPKILAERRQQEEAQRQLMAQQQAGSSGSDMTSSSSSDSDSSSSDSDSSSSSGSGSSSGSDSDSSSSDSESESEDSRDRRRGSRGRR